VVQVPVGLLFEVWRIQAELGAAVTQANIPNLAFLCRNALELHVWARYVASSMLAAKRFHQDARPDHQGRPPVASGSWVIRARAGTEVPSPLDPNLLRWPREQPD